MDEIADAAGRMPGRGDDLHDPVVHFPPAQEDVDRRRHRDILPLRLMGHQLRPEAVTDGCEMRPYFVPMTQILMGDTAQVSDRLVLALLAGGVEEQVPCGT